MAAKRKSKVYWTDEEMAQVIAEAVKLSLEDKEFTWSFVGKGQKVLPEERRRSIMGKAGINSKIMDAFCQARQDALDTGVPFQVTIEKESVEVLVERPREEILRSVTNEELTGLIAKRLLAPIFDSIPALLQKGREWPSTGEATFAGGETRVVQPPRASAPRKPKVLLYGFLPGQETDIREKAKGFTLIDLIFAEKDSRMKGTLPSCQWCVMLMKSSHAASGKLKKSLGNDRIFPVEGISMAVKALADINSQVGTGVR